MKSILSMIAILGFSASALAVDVSNCLGFNETSTEQPTVTYEYKNEQNALVAVLNFSDEKDYSSAGLSYGSATGLVIEQIGVQKADGKALYVYGQVVNNQFVPAYGTDKVELSCSESEITAKVAEIGITYKISKVDENSILVSAQDKEGKDHELGVFTKSEK